ncbi:DNA-binding IclR family transcriptional regulator [Kibdelosporangium banguiense]|uniref:DNA-binding IclR family transcriptional regulator n=1 Tax=Kibdelosporangium banguiense TaxID=1365924 RepID=A0ABS4TXU2_9PSEU|nr:IclR family transcriptional regulator [Kibdelosporangium banguiense]MBP2329223.1 DNA-binding IclR family transcriptional regulator [Kibdelosporangium banguiense]
MTLEVLQTATGHETTIGGSHRDAGTTNTVNRAIALLNSFEPEDPRLNLTQLAERTGLSKSTALRMLNTLRGAGLVARSGNTYTLGERLVMLAAIASGAGESGPTEQLRETAMPFLQDLFATTGQTVHLAVLEGTDVLYLEKLFGHRRTKTPSRVGARCPAISTAVGKAILAHSSGVVLDNVTRNLRPITAYTLASPPAVIHALRRVQNEGFALDNQEAAIGLTCGAAPILTRRDGCVAAVSVAGSLTDFDPRRAAPAIRRTAVNIGLALDAAQVDPSQGSIIKACSA